MFEIVEIFIESKINKIEIIDIVVVEGLGLYIGFRIGVIVVKILVYVLNINLYGVLLFKVFVSIVKDSMKLLVFIFDVRREVVYVGVY